jgi:hypothetical protein
MALTLVMGILPLTLGLIAFAEIGWTYHALVTLTRQGARYAATHCWQDDGSNVISWMQANAPAFLDRAQLATGGGTIQVSYWTHNLDMQESDPFSPPSGGCTLCVPDSVTVAISPYPFNHFLTALGLRLQVPPFATTVEMESAGGDPEMATVCPP